MESDNGYNEVKVKVPALHEFIFSLTDKIGPLDEESRGDIISQYAYEMSNLFSYAKGATKPMITFDCFVKQGRQWIAGFAVKDLGIADDPNKVNWHMQNTSQWVYAGAMVYDERDGRVSCHH
jgi:hypothetical protein